MLRQSPDRRVDDLCRHRDRISSPRAPRALTAAEEWHMTKSLSKRVGSLSRARPLLYPLVLLSQNNDTTQNNQVHEHLQVHMRKTIRRCASGDDTATRCPIAVRAPRRPSMRPRAQRPADGPAVELEPRQSVLGGLAGSKTIAHSDLQHAQIRVRQPRAQGAVR